MHSISPCNSKHSAFKKQPNFSSLPTHNDFRRGRSSNQFTSQYVTLQHQCRIVNEGPKANRNGFEQRTVLNTARILCYNSWEVDETTLFHNELPQFGEMTHLHAQDVMKSPGADVNGLQTRIVLQTQLCHILFTSTVRAAIQMGDGGRQRGLVEGLRIVEAVHIA